MQILSKFFFCDIFRYNHIHFLLRWGGSQGDVPQSVRKIALPCNDEFIFFKKSKIFQSKTAMHPSSHSCPMETNDALVEPWITCPVLADYDRHAGRGRRPFIFA